MRHHRPKPRRLKRGEAHSRVAYFNRLTGWYRVGSLIFHGETDVSTIIRIGLSRGLTVRFSITGGVK